jgi:succinoglycan biosynthesis protein ExoA
MKCLGSLVPGIADWQLVLLGNGEALSPAIREKARGLTEHVVFLETAAPLAPGAARNLALREAQGEWLFFIDDDAVVLPGYWEVLFPLLAEEKVDVLGGPDAPAAGMNALGTALALALASPFCTGTTYARHRAIGIQLRSADEQRLTSCNLWVRRSALASASFPEDYLRGEETLFLQRLAAAKRRLFYHPRLRVGHHRRAKLRQLLRPTFYAGFYRSRLLREKLRPGAGAFWLPAVFVLLHLLFFVDAAAFWYLARMYVGLILFVAVGVGTQAKRPGLIPLIAFLHYFVVFMYGVGFLVERAAPRRR